MSEIGQKVIAAVRAKAAANPDFVYKPVDLETGEPDEDFQGSCVYVAKGCPSCIVGHGLWDAGVIDAGFEIMAQNTMTFMSYNSDRFPVINDMEPDEVDWLEAVQARQDGGEPWAKAIAEADEEAAEGA